MCVCGVVVVITMVGTEAQSIIQISFSDKSERKKETAPFGAKHSSNCALDLEAIGQKSVESRFVSYLCGNHSNRISQLDTTAWDEGRRNQKTFKCNSYEN